MKIYSICTISESGNYYLYHVQSEDKPNNKQIERFLIDFGNDRDVDEDYTYEHVLNVLELKTEGIITI